MSLKLVLQFLPLIIIILILSWQVLNLAPSSCFDIEWHFFVAKALSEQVGHSNYQQLENSY